MSEPLLGLIAFDLDGTAIESRHDAMPSEQLIEAVASLQGRYAITAATSRPLPYCRDVLRSLQLSVPAVVAGGSEIVDENLNILHQELIGDQRDKLEKILHDLDASCYLGNTAFTDPLDTKEVMLDEPTSGIYFLDLDFHRAKGVSYRFRDVPGVRSLYMKSMLPGSDGFDVHILSARASKGTGIAHVQRQLGIGVMSTIVIGDGYNDVPLFEQAGVRVAMGNADEVLKDLADIEIGDVATDGLVHFLDWIHEYNASPAVILDGYVAS